jgi:hypothetical protein
LIDSGLGVVKFWYIEVSNHDAPHEKNIKIQSEALPPR